MAEESASIDVDLTPPSSRSHTPPSQPQPQYLPPQIISPRITLQTPLSRRGRGPGLILVLDHYALVEKSERHLDPPPLQKWAEEGFCVVQMRVPGQVEDGGEFPLQKALEVLRECERCEGEGIGLISYISRAPFYFEQAVFLNPKIKAIVSYGGRKFTTISADATSFPPQLIHIAGAELPRRKSCTERPVGPEPVQGSVKEYRYPEAKRDSGWVLPSDEEYHKPSAGIAHTRSLTYLKPLLNGPYFDLEAVWDEHCKYEFHERDVAKTMATMVDAPYVNHIPTMTGGIGKDRLTAFYTHHFIFCNPPDTALSLVSRTVGVDRVIDEFVFSFTHTKEVPWLIPGIPPTGKRLEIPFTSIVGMRGDRLCHEHISWDQGTVLQQLGLLPEWATFPYPIDGQDAPGGKRYEVALPIVGAETARKLVDESSEESNKLMERKWRVVDAQ